MYVGIFDCYDNLPSSMIMVVGAGPVLHPQIEIFLLIPDLLAYLQKSSAKR